MASIGEILLNTLSPDQQIREAATSQLETAANEDFKQYVVMLCQELNNEQSQARIPAGLALKNALTARESARREGMSARWMNIDEPTRSQIKALVLTTLGTPDLRAGVVTAQVVAAIAAIELPMGQWEDVIRLMLQNLQTTENTNLKQCTLQAIGFVCETIHRDILTTQANSILTAVVQGARKDEPSEAVRLAAISALYNSLEFVEENFKREGERNYIMQVVCEATQSQDVQVQIASFECLVRIMQLYYEYMPFYMQKALFGLTVQGMKHENERVALQAVEFWSTVCEEEIDLESARHEAFQNGAEPDVTNYNFAKAALPETLPVLLQLMAKQDEDDEEDDWNLSMAAGTCLSLTAQCVGDPIVGPVIQFVEANIRNAGWQYREASVMAFGSILEGPSQELLAPPVAQALPFLIDMMNDPVIKVKDTTAWTLGRVSQSLVECIKPDVHLQPLIEALVRGLDDSNRIVSNCCLSLMNLAEQLEGEQGPDSPTSLMSPFFDGIVTALMRITGRSTNEAFSRTSAYEAISILVSHSAKDTFPTISALATTILDRLEQSIAVQNQIIGVDERNSHNELQSNICSVLTNIIRRVGGEIAPMADRIMTVLLQLLTAASRHSTILEDAFLAIGALTTALEAEFARYLETFAPFLFNALQNHEEYQLCSIAVGLIGDICRSLGAQSATYCDNFMATLLQNLQSPVLHRNVKPAILSCFGDIALAIEGQFGTYLDVTMTVLAQACNIRAASSDYDMIDYVNQLREGIVDAYVGIVQGLKASDRSALLQPHLEHVFDFLHAVYNDPERTDTLLRNMIGLIGDLAESFPNGAIKMFLQAEWIGQCLKEGRSSRQNSVTTKEVARWAKEMVKRATL
ncbi:karyopherin beta [Entomortierella chlamydospora]|uniref:Importin-95 n=1 Tax=Entomortierella chlamydospora TaxID=101097 RepID=A0A9P6T4K4_9FUNG|nr:karyopherin beta [Entomortierella chlamydospora]KAG0024321.1 karyopherin beta [Entomortierella chlamydospora]